MKVLAVHPARRIQVIFARTWQLIGWTGAVGIALFVAAMVVALLAWVARKEALRERGADHAVFERSPEIVVDRVATSPSPTQTATTNLPSALDVPLLLTQMEQAAVGNGLGWRAAEYRITPATNAKPAVLEVRCAVQGPYPRLRGMLVQLMSAVPAFAIREFSASRPNADVSDVEAKLLFAVFLRDEDSGIANPAKGPP